MPLIPRTTAPPSKARAATILSVGRRAYVNCRGRVALAHDDGRLSENSLADGAEVEIMAWRPRGAGGTRYRVHARQEGHEGWLAADSLRQTAAPVAKEPPPRAASPVAAPPRPLMRDTHRKFGQR
jgi:hypothetical protein